MIRRATEHPTLVGLYDYWQRKRSGREMPDRRDIDPTEIPPAILPHLAMFDLIEGAQRVRVRLLGTALVQRFGEEHTGSLLEQVLSGDYLVYVHELHREIFRLRVPIYSESAFHWTVERSAIGKRLYLPLSNGGTDPAITLAGHVFEAPEELLYGKLLLSKAARHELRREVLGPERQ